MIRIANFNVNFDDTRDLKVLAAERLGVSDDMVSQVKVVRKAVDARRFHGAPIRFVYMLDVALKGSEKKLLSRWRKDRNVSKVPEAKVSLGKFSPMGKDDLPPVVVGFGPAGMFAALTLARHGWQPVVVERGRDVDRRHQDIQKFWNGGAFDDDVIPGTCPH